MTKSKLEYIWLDGYTPTANLRSKTKIEADFGGKLEDCPMWSFDGSSTQQAEGNSSDCILKPVACYPDPARKNGFLVIKQINLNSVMKMKITFILKIIDVITKNYIINLRKSKFKI